MLANAAPGIRAITAASRSRTLTLESPQFRTREKAASASSRRIARRSLAKRGSPCKTVRAGWLTQLPGSVSCEEVPGRNAGRQSWLEDRPPAGPALPVQSAGSLPRANWPPGAPIPTSSGFGSNRGWRSNRAIGRSPPEKWATQASRPSSRGSALPARGRASHQSASARNAWRPAATGPMPAAPQTAPASPATAVTPLPIARSSMCR